MGIDSNSQPRHNGGGSSAWPLFALLIVAGVVIYLMQARRPALDDTDLGQPLPPLEAAGWLNSDRPLTMADLRGEIVLVDYWATWCSPCRVNMPHLVATYQRFKDHGLKVVGFTPEGPEDRSAIERYLESLDGFDWPVAYGAQMTLEIMGISGIPTLVLYDRSGTSVWRGHSHRGLDEAIVAALAQE